MIYLQEEYKKSLQDVQQDQWLEEAFQNQTNPENGKSQHLSAYLYYLPNCPSPTHDCFNQKSIIYHPNNHPSTNQEWFILEKELEFNHDEVLSFRVKLSTFELRLSLLNIEGPNPFLKQTQHKKGNYGKVYQFRFLKQSIVFKVFPYGPQIQSSIIIKAAIKEYAIMKICAALGCGPNVESNFGFDLVAYDDSVMFCMEQCVPIDRFAEGQIASLKHSLRLMHCFKIIHFDVKPDNVMFSLHFGKPVFIDFGFSEVIGQELGSKTLVQFRGSPGYCSRQMAELLGAQNSKISIDVYYSDCQALRKTIIQLQAVKHPSEADSSDQQELEYQEADNHLESQHKDNSLLLILLKYKFFIKEKSDIVLLLRMKQCILLKLYGGVVLDYSRKFLPQTLFESIYRQFKRQFHHFIDPTLLEAYFKYNFRHCLYPTNNSYEENIQVIFSDYRHRIKGHENQVQYSLYDKYKQFLEMENVFVIASTAERAKTILIECLRFDLKNFNIQDKIILADRFNRAFGIKSGQNLSAVKSTFQYLFEQCISQPITSSKKEKIFLVLSQFLMLDLNLEPYFDSLITVLAKIHLSFKEMIDCWMKISKILHMQAFKYIFDHRWMRQEFQSKMLAFGTQLLFTALKQYGQSNDEQTRYILAALDIYIKSKESSKISFYFRQLTANLKKVKSNTFQKDLIQIIYLGILQLCYSEDMDDQVSTLYDIIKEANFLHIFQEKSNTFSIFTFYIYEVFVTTKDHRQVLRLFNNVIKAINCTNVSSKYKFQMCHFLFSEKQDPKKLYQYATEILQFPACSRRQKFNYEFWEVMQKMKKDKAFRQTYPQVLEKYMMMFIECDEEAKTEEKVITSIQIESIMYRYCTLRLCLRLDFNISSKILMRVIDSQKEKIIKNSLDNMSILEQLSYNLHLQIEYEITNFPLKRLEALQKIYQTALKIQSQKLILYFLKIIIRCATFEQNEDQVFHYALIFYNFTHTVPSYTRYFLGHGASLIVATLYEFQRCQRMDEFYNFLILLAKFVAKFPSKEIILEWIHNIGTFMQLKQYNHLLSYQVLSSKIGQICWDNHYYVCYYAFSLQIEKNKANIMKILIKIAQSIGFITTHAKQIILPTFIRSIMYYFQANLRRLIYLTLRWGYKYLPRHQFLLNTRLNQVKLKSNGNYTTSLPKRYLKMKALHSLKLSSTIRYKHN